MLNRGVRAEVRRPCWYDDEVKTMSNLLHHNKDGNDEDGSSTSNRKSKCRTRRIRTKNGVVMVVIDRRVRQILGRPEQRPDDARRISIWEGAG